ncbi:hypothetical protein KBB49_00510 [Candidatus Saccharibacteria bacterium]|jgi:hypothetical protein|nr:hypothetical protein [Candidatus Saccharibacteria bacterium]
MGLDEFSFELPSSGDVVTAQISDIPAILAASKGLIHLALESGEYVDYGAARRFSDLSKHSVRSATSTWEFLARGAEPLTDGSILVDPDDPKTFLYRRIYVADRARHVRNWLSARSGNSYEKFSAGSPHFLVDFANQVAGAEPPIDPIRLYRNRIKKRITPRS